MRRAVRCAWRGATLRPEPRDDAARHAAGRRRDARRRGAHRRCADRVPLGAGDLTRARRGALQRRRAFLRPRRYAARRAQLRRWRCSIARAGSRRRWRWGTCCSRPAALPTRSAPSSARSAIDGQSVEALGNLGLTLQRRGNADAAQRYLERARSLAPGDTHAWFALRGNLARAGAARRRDRGFSALRSRCAAVGRAGRDRARLRARHRRSRVREQVPRARARLAVSCRPGRIARGGPVAPAVPRRSPRSHRAAVPRSTTDCSSRIFAPARDVVAARRCLSRRAAPRRLSFRGFSRPRDGTAAARGALRTRSLARFPAPVFALAAVARRRAHGAVSRTRRLVHPARRRGRRCRGARHRRRRHRHPGRPDGPYRRVAPRHPPAQAGAGDRHAPRLSRLRRALAGRFQDHRRARRRRRCRAIPDRGAARCSTRA